MLQATTRPTPSITDDDCVLAGNADHMVILTPEDVSALQQLPIPLAVLALEATHQSLSLEGAPEQVQ